MAGFQVQPLPARAGHRDTAGLRGSDRDGTQIFGLEVVQAGFARAARHHRGLARVRLQDIGRCPSAFFVVEVGGEFYAIRRDRDLKS